MVRSFQSCDYSIRYSLIGPQEFLQFFHQVLRGVLRWDPSSPEAILWGSPLKAHRRSFGFPTRTLEESYGFCKYNLSGWVVLDPDLLFEHVGSLDPRRFYSLDGSRVLWSPYRILRTFYKVYPYGFVQEVVDSFTGASPELLRVRYSVHSLVPHQNSSGYFTVSFGRPR